MAGQSPTDAERECFAVLGKTDSRFAVLADLVAKSNGLWCAEAEQYVLANAKNI